MKSDDKFLETIDTIQTNISSHKLSSIIGKKYISCKIDPLYNLHDGDFTFVNMVEDVLIAPVFKGYKTKANNIRNTSNFSLKDGIMVSYRYILCMLYKFDNHPFYHLTIEKDDYIRSKTFYFPLKSSKYRKAVFELISEVDIKNKPEIMKFIKDFVIHLQKSIVLNDLDGKDITDESLETILGDMIKELGKLILKGDKKC